MLTSSQPWDEGALLRELLRRDAGGEHTVLSSTVTSFEGPDWQPRGR